MALGIHWAPRSDAVLVGLGSVDAGTICQAQPMPLGATANTAKRDEMLFTDP